MKGVQNFGEEIWK